MVLPKVKNSFQCRTEILLPDHMFHSLATMKTMLTTFQYVLLSSGGRTIKAGGDFEEKEPEANLKEGNGKRTGTGNETRI